MATPKLIKIWWFIKSYWWAIVVSIACVVLLTFMFLGILSITSNDTVKESLLIAFKKPITETPTWMILLISIIYAMVRKN